MDQLPDMTFLSEEERNLILSVLQRDEELRHGQQNRACEIKQEVQELRLKSALRNGDDLSKICARCKTPFGFLFNTGDLCPVCRFRVCKDCREARLDSHGWMCTLCFKENQLRWLSSATPTKKTTGEETPDPGSPNALSPPSSFRDQPSSRSASPTLYTGGGQYSKRRQADHTPSRKAPATSRRPEGLPQIQASAAAASVPEKDQGDADSGFSTPAVSPEDESAARQDSGSSAEKETTENRGTSGSPTQSKGKSVFSKSKNTNVAKSDVKGGKDSSQSTVAKSKTASTKTGTGQASKTAKAKAAKVSKAEQKKGVTCTKNPPNKELQSSNCSFTSSEPPEEGSPKSDNRTSQPSKGKKDEVDSALGQSSGYISTDLADTQPNGKAQKSDCPSLSKSGAEDSKVKSPQANPADSKDARLPSQRQQTSVNNHHTAAQRSPVLRQASGFSETFSDLSAKTASPGTKIRLLDLASNRALERDGADSLRSWSGGSEDTLSLGLSCSGLSASAQAPVFRTDEATDGQGCSGAVEGDRNGREAQHEEEEGRKPRGPEEEDLGGDSAYSSAGSVAVCLHTDRCTCDSEAKLDSGRSDQCGTPDNAGLESLEDRPVMGPMDSLDDVESIAEPDGISDPDRLPELTEDVKEDVMDSHNTSQITDPQNEDDDDTDPGNDSYESSFGSGKADINSSEAEFSDESLPENETVPEQILSPPAEHDDAAIRLSDKNVPTLEEQMAEVQKMRNPENMTYTMQRFIQADDTGSDTLSIISERTEPEDSETKTEKEYTMYAGEDSDSEGTVHDDVDGQWSDDSDVIDAGAATPRRQSVVEMDEAEFLLLQQKQANDASQRELESGSETPPASDHAQADQINGYASENNEDFSDSTQASSLPVDPSVEDSSVQTDDLVGPLQGKASDPQTSEMSEVEISCRSTSSEDSSTQTEDVLFISKEQQDLFHDLLIQQEADKPTLRRSYSEDWTQTEPSAEEEEEEDPQNLEPQDLEMSACQNLTSAATDDDSLASDDTVTEQEKAHEAERRRALTPDQSQSSERDHVDGGDQLEEAGAMSRDQRSNSMGDLLADSPQASRLPYKRRAFTGSVDQLNHDDDDGSVSRYRKKGKSLSRSRFSLAASRESLNSVYSAAGEINYGRIPVSGDITFGLAYDQKQSVLNINLKDCQDLAPVDTKHNRSDPYVKTYLLPDKTRSGKRKSKIKKRTLNPVYNETLSYHISPGELETRTLWVTVWHSDLFGRNDFLGEVNIPMDMELFEDTTPQTYTLQSRMMSDGLSEVSMQYKGEVILSLMYVTADKARAAREEAPKKAKSRSKKSKMATVTGEPLGEVHVMVKSAKHLMAVRSSGSSDPFVKGYLLPERSRARKQKTPVVKNSLNPMWNHILVFEGVDEAELAEHSLELTVWDHEKLGTNQFLGGTRLNLGLGVAKGEQQVDWMDGKGGEVGVWQDMMDRPDTWVDAVIPLRATMGKANTKK